MKAAVIAKGPCRAHGDESARAAIRDASGVEGASICGRGVRRTSAVTPSHLLAYLSRGGVRRERHVAVDTDNRDGHVWSREGGHGVRGFLAAGCDEANGHGEERDRHTHYGRAVHHLPPRRALPGRSITGVHVGGGPAVAKQHRLCHVSVVQSSFTQLSR